MTNLVDGAITLLPLVTNFAERCQQPMAYLQEGCPNWTQRSNLCAIPLKKVKFKVEHQEAVIVKKLSEDHIQIMLYPSISQTAHLKLVRQFL